MSPPAPLTPVTIITGFLGSGKTTLIARLLRDPDLSDTAVIVNEFGEVGLDHALVEAVQSEVVLLPQGCLCCTLNGSLAATLEGLDMRRLAGAVPPFRRVVVETTGLADPVPVLQTLLDRAMLLRGYVPARVLTTIDAVTGGATLERHAEARRQIAIADRLLLTKTDLAGDASDLVGQVRALNMRAPLLNVLHGDISPHALLGDAGGELPRVPHGRFTAEHAHTRRLATTVVRPSGPLPFELLADWLGGLVAEHGDRLLRVKGVVAVEGHSRPVAVHGVQHIFHPPRFLEAWPDRLVEPALVFILDGLEPSVIHQSAASAGLISKGGEQ
ncbi:MAG TPA: GTP-binding protein [Rhodopila sp.]|nr:GTP-binding protein [Rhodopila sp.]